MVLHPKFGSSCFRACWWRSLQTPAWCCFCSGVRMSQMLAPIITKTQASQALIIVKQCNMEHIFTKVIACNSYRTPYVHSRNSLRNFNWPFTYIYTWLMQYLNQWLLLLPGMWMCCKMIKCKACGNLLGLEASVIDAVRERERDGSFFNTCILKRT